jgi:hypothetical protein
MAQVLAEPGPLCWRSTEAELKLIGPVCDAQWGAPEQDMGQLRGTPIEKAKRERQLFVDVKERTSEESIVTDQLRGA